MQVFPVHTPVRRGQSGTPSGGHVVPGQVRRALALSLGLEPDDCFVDRPESRLARALLLTSGSFIRSESPTWVLSRSPNMSKLSNRDVGFASPPSSLPHACEILVHGGTRTERDRVRITWTSRERLGLPSAAYVSLWQSGCCIRLWSKIGFKAVHASL